MTLRVLIVDDEPLGRRGVRVRLARAEGVEVVGECSSAREAVAAIAELSPDVVFLDVQMPGLDGFGVVEAVGPETMPTTVFVTAFDQYALRAFEAQALDYLLKPIDDDRFEQALDRARQRVVEQRDGTLGRQVSAALGMGRTPDPPEPRFLADHGARVAVVRREDIDWVEAAGDYVRLHAGGRTHLLRETMGRIEDRLGGTPFVRIHRSTIVNVERVRELRPHANREYGVVLADGSEVRLSRSYRERLADAMGVDL